jgi:hypothetical protein
MFGATTVPEQSDELLPSVLTTLAMKGNSTIDAGSPPIT